MIWSQDVVQNEENKQVSSFPDLILQSLELMTGQKDKCITGSAARFLSVFTKGDVVLLRQANSTLTHTARNMITTTCLACSIYIQYRVSRVWRYIVELECDKQWFDKPSRLWNAITSLVFAECDSVTWLSSIFSLWSPFNRQSRSQRFSIPRCHRIGF